MSTKRNRRLAKPSRIKRDRDEGLDPRRAALMAKCEAMEAELLYRVILNRLNAARDSFPQSRH
jgi:hypothetical protein